MIDVIERLESFTANAFSMREMHDAIYDLAMEVEDGDADAVKTIFRVKHMARVLSVCATSQGLAMADLQSALHRQREASA